MDKGKTVKRTGDVRSAETGNEVLGEMGMKTGNHRGVLGSWDGYCVLREWQFRPFIIPVPLGWIGVIHVHHCTHDHNQRTAQAVSTRVILGFSSQWHIVTLDLGPLSL